MPTRPQPWYRCWWRASLLAIRGVLRLDDTPRRIATGVGCGLFASVLPILGQTVVGIILTRLLKGNVIASLPWSWLSNPVTSPAIFYGCYRVGAALLPGEGLLSWEQIRAMAERFQSMGFTEALGHAAELFADAAVPLAFGSLVVGMVAGGIGFLCALTIVQAIQARRARQVRPTA